MAFNLKEMAVDYKKLLKMVPTQRAEAAQSGLINNIIASLTPGQMVSLFPRYYREKLPDVGNVNRYSSGLDVALSGGTRLKYRNNNANYAPGPTLEEMKADLLKKGIDVDNAYETVGSGVLENDPRVKYMKAIPTDELAKIGFQRTNDENGKTIIKAIPTKSANLTDAEISNMISGKLVAKDSATDNQKAVLDFANRWNISPEAAAGVLQIESGVTNNATNGNYHGVFQLGTDQVGPRSKDAGFGALSPSQFRQLSVADQLKVMDEYYKFWKIEPGFFTGDPKTDSAKMWALQLSPGSAKSIDYSDPNAVISETNQASVIESRDGLITVGSASEGSVSRGINYLGESVTRIEGNATPEQIAAARKDMINRDMAENESKLARRVYGQENQYAETATPIGNTGYSLGKDGSTLGPEERRSLREQGGITINLDNNAGASVRDTSSFNPMIVIPDNATDEQKAAAKAYVDQIAEAYNKKFGTNLQGKVTTRSENGRGRTDTIHTEAFNVRDTKAIEYFYNDKEGQQELARITSSTLGQIPGAHFQLPHGGTEGQDKGAVGPYGSEVDLAGRLMNSLNELKQQAEEKAKLEAAKAQPTPAPAAPQALPAESKVQSTMTATAVNPGTITPPVINSGPTAPPPPKPDESAMRPPMPQQTSLPPPSYPYTISEMSGGDSHAPPSQYRAFNNARLYGEQSTRLVNGHFA